MAASDAAVESRPESWFSLDGTGVRYGFPGNSSGDEFSQAEAYLNGNMPWGFGLGKGWGAKTQLQATAGVLRNEVNGGIFSLGPALLVRKNKSPLALDIGLSPAMLTRHEFPQKNFGINFQFATHMGLTLDLSRKVQIGYRFQHMSNAHLDERNPGLNLHMVAVGYRIR
jgi:hypothetical protein